MQKLLVLLILVISYSNPGRSQANISDLKKERIQTGNGEKWWGGAVNDGVKMPFENGYTYDMYGDLRGNQAQPLLLSNQGRIIWSELPFQFTVTEHEILIEGRGEIIVSKGLRHLRDAYGFAAENYFSPDGKMPDRLLFEQPQYNTWIELMYDQNQADILKYAHAIVDNGFPPGVLMIDDNWQEAYGKWKFHPGRFPSPKAMIDELHELGFKVMLWVCPFVSPDTDVFRSAAAEGLFLKYPDNYTIAGSNYYSVAMVGWWNGYSALLDFSNPRAAQWFKGELQHLVDEYDVDGFKLDAGDAEYYPSWLLSHEPDILPNDHAALFAQIGLDFPLNEYRATWKMAGKPLAQRLRDKGHTWKDLQSLIPNITVQGLMGYAFTCPDMIGGGEFTSFLDETILDQELIVRSAQVHALMPMMQFSVAPWRILDENHLDAVKKAIEIRRQFTPVILDLAEKAASDGQPIVRTMEYVFPNAPYENIKDQFMLGDDILVAPVLSKGQKLRTVTLPPGKWKGFDGKIHDGNKAINIAVELVTIPYFLKVE